MLLDAELTAADRATAFAQLMTVLLERLVPDEFDAFCRIAETSGEAAAMAYLARCR